MPHSETCMERIEKNAVRNQMPTLLSDRLSAVC